MNKIRFSEHVLPHLIAVGVFLIITVFFFNAIIFNNKTLEQHDIQQFLGSSKSIVDYRNQTGEEALWTNSMFSGMPAYLISVVWSNQAIAYLKTIFALGLPHPIANIFVAFVCYYIMLLTFGVRPYLAIIGAIGFGLSSYMIIGLGAGHNARIGAIAFMPLVMAGIHLAFTNRKLLGFGLTTAALALHLRENHLQMTYYLLIIVAAYGVIQLIEAVREKRLADFSKTVALLIPAAIIAAGTFFGQFWAITEYTAYSIRGKSELVASSNKNDTQDASGLSKDYAFQYSNGIIEPFTLLIPNILGGSTSNYLVLDQKSETYKALARSGNQQAFNQLANYSSAYWGPQSNTSPYYAGAIIVFLFAVGIAFADKKYTWWLLPISFFAIMLSWGSSFSSFNYFIFDYFPGYNKFRSVTFALVIVLFAMPLLGMLGLEKIMQQGIDKKAKQKLLIAFAATGGLCLLFIMFAGMFGFARDFESQLPAWFADALSDDRKSLLRSDAFRSLAFITAVFIAIYFNVQKKSPMGFFAFMIFFVTIDLAVINKRYLKDESFKRKRDNTFFAQTEADQEILKDKSYYRVFNVQSDPFGEAKTSYYHHSVGGYHGAKMRRYQDFYDSCLIRQTQQLFTEAQQGKLDFEKFGALNMLNIKYIVIGPQRDNVIKNTAANGPAWFVKDVLKVNSPSEELAQSCIADTRSTAVIDISRNNISITPGYDSAASVNITETKPNYIKYESNSAADGIVVFSEIYYPKGWTAAIDGKEVPILGANFILRALEVPAGNHTIEFKFAPKAYAIGNQVTMASSWVALLVLLTSLGLSVRKEINGKP